MAAVEEAGWVVVSEGRWRKPWAEPPWESFTGMVRGWIMGGEWPGPEESIGVVRGGKAEGWS